ncbi:ATP-binding protein [Tropicibacter sp. S64]|uniref:PAS domain-containing hybrid sensor histidine kinase/response regulator n=1 Tax=Tropicibacter sp. S64 TaxID=3415122 RepID=UPI003C7AEB29
MTGNPKDQIRLAPSVKPALAAMLLVLFMALIGFLGLHVTRQLTRLENAASESVLWALTQAELESSRLEAATLHAMVHPEQSLEELRVRFDVYYSRMAIVRDNENYIVLRDTPETREALDHILDFFETWIPLIDGPDAALAASLPALSEATAEMRAQTRLLSIDGVTRNAVRSSEQRASLASTLTSIAWLTALLIAVLLGLLVTLFRLARLREAQSSRNQAMRRRLETIISTSLDAIIVTDRQGRIVEYNGAAEGIFGYSRTEALGARVTDLIIPPEHRSDQQQALNAYLDGLPEERRSRFVAGIEAMRKNGDRFPVETSIASARTAEGERIVSFLRDISDRKAAETELREARDRAIAGERSKARLLAVMSHEMRTPLNGILGTLDLMGTRDLNPGQSRYLTIVRNSAKMLLDQVNDVLDLSRLDAQKMQTDKRHFDLVALATEVVESQVGAAAANGNVLTLTPPSPLLHDVWTDPDRLRQILLNLLSNAIKFTHGGRVTLEIDCTAGLDEVEFRVFDTGIGIAEEDLDRIFGDFVTLDTSYQRTNKGTGLGLGIARRLTRALGGEIGAESEPGDGSIFWVRLSLTPPRDEIDSGEASETEDAPHPAAGPAMSALIVEDNAINRLILRRMLEKDGHAVTEAFDGAEGVAKAARRRFDVIFMDISMPGMDGLEATRHIRETCPLNAQTRIIATTAHALPEEQEAFLAAGMCGVLLKPLTRQALRQVLAQSGVPAMPDSPLSPAPLVDPENLATLKDLLNEAEQAKRLHRFIDEIEGFLAAPHGQEDPATLAMEAHRLSGSAGLFGALRLARVLQTLETGAAVADDAGRQALCEAVRSCWQDTRPVLERETAGDSSARDAAE